MLREYQLENFKAFAGPETIPIRPITLIYGPNSSGKSSILQSLLLLKQTLEEAENSEPLLLPKGTLVDLGNYRQFVYRHDIGNEFSFKVNFDLVAHRVKPSWIRELLETTGSTLVGLSVGFAYDKETEGILLSSLEVFVGSEPLPVIIYELEQVSSVDNILRGSNTNGEEASLERLLKVSRISSQHGFWRAWWTADKHFAEQKLLRFLIAELEDLSRPEEAENEKEVKETQEIRDSLIQKCRQDVENYTFERALESFMRANEKLLLSCRNFLPTRVLSAPYSARESHFSVAITNLLKADLSWPKRDVSSLTFYVSSLFQQFARNVVYLGPLRDYPERHYVFSGNLSEYVGKSGRMMPDVLFKNPKLLKLVNEQLGRFGLRYELKVSSLRYETSELSNAFAFRLVDKETGVDASIVDVGFGVSQVLPIIVQSLLSRSKTLLIEQPEIHLHPALQAELGDVFIQSALGEQQNTFILETHSEHLMLRILRRIRETTDGELEPGLIPIRPEHVAVLYVLPDKNGAKVIEIPIRPDGEFAEHWPQGFFAERAKELF